MFHYGTLIANTTILLINGVGTILQCCYILLYMLVTPEVSTIVPVLAAAGLYESVLYYYIFAVATDEGEVTAALGSTSSLLNMLNMTMLASELRNNLRNQDANGTPTVMVVSGMAAALSWLVYGIMLRDPYIYVPNIPALIIGAGKTYATLAFTRDKDIKTI
ncbi:hypothetical protein NP493_104g00000 [Ridgeia piscesae]|uniref:Sugar transporter SWEET1 n=1 Tax=Ridgeia piscesae TaxID=27915 RepID=A0AAD9P7C3_RIDPI|nr:hypothetical protein NP493_104g00000 [Ridgeia piscesae]